MKKVSAVILSYNVPDKLLRCVRSLFTQPEINELILIENHSLSDMTDAYRDIEDLCKAAHVAYHFYKPEKAFNFSEGQNYGIEQAKNATILLMNKGAFFKDPDTLKTSIKLLSPSVKLVGHKILNDDGTVNHFGFFADGLTGKKGHLARFFSPKDPRIQETVSVIAVTAAVLLLDRTDIRFDEAYWFENEDVDFCFQHIQRGWEIMCNPDCVAIHQESSARGVAQKTDSEWARKQDVGSWYFKKKWRGFMIRHTPQFWPKWGLLSHDDQQFFKNTYGNVIAGIVTAGVLLIYPGPVLFFYLLIGVVTFFAVKKLAMRLLLQLLKPKAFQKKHH